MSKPKPGKFMETDFLTAEQVAAYLQVHKLTIYKYIREGRLPAVRLGRTFRVAREDVQRFLNAQRVSQPVHAQRVSQPVEAQRVSRRGSERPRGEPRAASGAARGRGGASSRPPVTPKHSDEIYVGPVREEHGRPREDVVTRNPLDWVIRGLH